ncbi:MAG: hypothetical protein K2X76_15725 [Sphingomonas sp.]|nr:hypothetical protein [Sphingomonas sp.]
MHEELMPDVASMSDSELLRAWHLTDGTGQIAEALLAEIERRQLDL